MISAQCITYGRPDLLEEAIESFLRQDYEGEKEMVILNDHPEQMLRIFDHPEVRIVNSSVRFQSIGEKRNACVGLCRGDVIFPWDDDDISLPWRISLSLKYKGEKRYFKNTAAWLWSNGEIKGIRKNVYHAMGCWDKSFFADVNGYPFMQSGQDGALEKRFSKTKERVVVEIPEDETYYIYKFGGTGHPHLSGYGWGKGWVEMGKKDVEKEGIINLNPKWKEDYIKKVNHGRT